MKTFEECLVGKDLTELYDMYMKNAPHQNNGLGDEFFSKSIVRKYINLAFKEKDTFQVGRGYFFLARLNDNNLELLDKSIQFTSSKNDKVHPCISYLWKFHKFYDDGQYRDAYQTLVSISNLKKSQYSLFKEDIKGLINILNLEWGDKKRGLKILEKQLHNYKVNGLITNGEVIYDQNYNNEFVLNIYHQISDVNYSLGNYGIALANLDTLASLDDIINSDNYDDKYNGLKGAILYKQGEYQEALSYTNEYLNNHIPNDAYGISRSSVIKGLTLWELNRQEEAVASLIKADSLYQHTKDEFEELGDGYKTLITYYKNKDNTDKQLEYLNKLLEFDEEITANYLEIAPAITRSYTIPELLSEKEQVIRSLNKKNQIAETKKTVYYSLLMFSSLLIGLFIVQRIRLKRRYNKLKQKLDVSLAQMSTASPKTTRKELFELDATQIERIAKGLDAFEKSKGYLDTTLSLKSLATAIDTNSSYLSKYVNAVKGVNFSNYISTLRIEYIMAELRVNARMRSYTIDAISEEAGFANARSFSNHFKRVTGINPSYFLKQLQKEMTTTEVVRPQTV
ncbi:MAG: helix-turn-helix domain-containing protein [Dokdonia sp.]